LRIGYLHLGEPHHGLHRYGSLLAAEAARRDDLDVVERSLVLSGRDDDRALLARTAEDFADVDVVHVQHNRDVWGHGAAQGRAVRAFVEACPAPVVATCHDVYPSDPWAPWRKRRWRWRRVRRHWRERVPTNRTLRWLLDRCAAVLVCSDEEARRLAGLARRGCAARVIDHFVEDRGPLPDRDAARRALSLSEARVVTLLGYIHPSKGHDVLVDALARLPEDVHAVLAGRASPGNEGFARRLARRAERSGTSARLHLTGWLEEEAQQQVLAATDLAVAPFRFFSASGSLSTWISACVPVLCHDLPQLDRYDAISPGAIRRFAPCEGRALAAAIERTLEEARTPDPAVARLREALLMPRVFDRHLEVYRECSETSGGGRFVVGDGSIG
jgi:glycosyltransferase involved in cell wall biosynthesis